MGMPPTPRPQTIPLPHIPDTVPARTGTRFNDAFDVNADVADNVEPQERMPPTPRLSTIPLPCVPAAVTPRADNRFNVASDVAVDVEGRVEPGVNPAPAAARQRDHPPLEDRVPGAPMLRTIPLPRVPPVVPVRACALPNADLNAEVDVEDGVGPSIGPPTTVPAALALRAAELTPPGAPRLCTIPLPSIPDVVHVGDDGRFKTGEDGARVIR